MSPLDLRLVGARVLMQGALADVPLRIAGGVVVEDMPGREVDLRGYLVMPGIVDIHGDGFEKHLAPRRGAMKDVGEGLIAAEAELAANGITTAVLAQFWSWEGGMRGPEFAARVFAGVAGIADRVVTDLILQLRFETPMLDHYDALAEVIAQHDIGYVVFNDHLPHDDLAKGKRPPRLTGQALRIGKNPERHLADMRAMHLRMDEVPAALGPLCARLAGMGVRMGSHDDRSPEERDRWRLLGARIAEFPETADAVETAAKAGDGVIMGAPNLVRGGSHKGNVSAAEQVMMGHVTALASDYHYPSLVRAMRLLARSGVMDLAAAWPLVSSGPAGLLGLEDRGAFARGQRADLVVLEPEALRVMATIAGGRVGAMKAEVAARFIG